MSHGTFCFVRSDPNSNTGKCHGGPTSWKWVLFPVVLYILEKAVREYYSNEFKLNLGSSATEITKIVQHPSKVVEVII
jgi:hypothetical protein